MFCGNCPQKKTCKSLCKEVEDYLRSQGIYSKDYIRPRVSPKKLKEERKHGHYYSPLREIPFTDLGRDKDGEYKFDDEE